MKTVPFVIGAALVAALGTSAVSAADVPVVDAYQTDPSTGAPLSLPQRVQKLEQQLAYIQQANLLTEIEHMQQEIQTLRGKLEVQVHDLKLLNDQQKSFYKDLDQRISKQQKVPAKDVPAQTSQNSKPASTDAVQQNLVAAASAATEAATVVAAASKPAIATAQHSSAASSQDASIYMAAYDLIRTRHYQQALVQMQAYLKKFPQGQYAANAYYWLGELFLLEGQSDHAISEFRTVVEKYPQHTKVPDAMLKIGFAYYDKGNLQSARDELEKVQKEFPGTSSARLATSRLEVINKPESHLGH